LPHSLNKKWLKSLMNAAETDTELAALYGELGSGLRPVEYLHQEAIDVREAPYREFPPILVHGKERDELRPMLSEELELLSHLTPSNLRHHKLVIRSRRVLGGVRQPMGAKAHTTRIYGIFKRACVPAGFIPYDLRDTFGSLVYRNCKDWFLTERLMRHVLPGEGKKYIEYPLDQLC
jgi:integrase